jgi:hypothetical protein
LEEHTASTFKDLRLFSDSSEKKGTETEHITHKIKIKEPEEHTVITNSLFLY